MDVTAFAIKHVFYPLWAAKNRSHRLEYLAQLEKSQYWRPETLVEHQWSFFKRVFAHAYETCPYYREKYIKAGITPDDLSSIDDIQRIPTITKEEIQERQGELVSKQYRREDLLRDMTGGSTGSPMEFFYDKERLDSREGATLRHNAWAGWDIGDRLAILWGAPRDTKRPELLKHRIRDRLLGQVLMLDASCLDEASMAEFARKLVQFQPKILLAYANTLGFFAKYLNGENINGIRPRGIVCSAEVLTEENRTLIERTFRCPVFNRYGSREFAVIASECSLHKGMHVNAENLLVEVLVDGKSYSDRDGEIVITDLRNFAMPMIRYRIKDTGRLNDHLCECSRGLPLLSLSGGRVTDFLWATDGKKVSGIVIATYVITSIPGVKQVQIVQDEMNSVILNLVKGPAWSTRTLNTLIERVRSFLGADMQVQIAFRDEIPLEKSGKYRFSISTLAK